MGFGIVENANRDGTDLFISIHEFSHAMFFDCLQTAACRLCLKMLGVCLGSWRAVWTKRTEHITIDPQRCAVVETCQMHACCTDVENQHWKRGNITAGS